MSGRVTPAARVPTASVAAEMLGLQRRAGNRVAVVRAGQIQAKLMVGSAYDPAERQADQVAHEVMRQLRSGSSTQLDEVAESEPAVRRAVLAGGVTAPIGVDGGELDAHLAGTIQSERGRGLPLPGAVLQPFERALGADLSGVRVHNDTRSAELNRAVSAKAFTIGSDIFLGAGQYKPNSADGQELLAHEVTHTIQQGH